METEDIPLHEQSPIYLATIAEMARGDIIYYTRLDCPKAVQSATRRYMEYTEALINVTITREIL